MLDPGGIQSVPEPSTLLLVALGLAAVASFGRRHRTQLNLRIRLSNSSIAGRSIKRPLF